MLVDSSFSQLYGKPPAIGGYYPDVYLAPSRENPLIIGEAKTAKDLEKAHSMDQIASFLKYCSFHTDSLLILGVPWNMTRCARSLLCYLQLNNNAEKVATLVLDKLEG